MKGQAMDQPVRQFSAPLIRRLPEYHAFCEVLLKQGQQTASSTTIASHCNIDPIVVRKDLESIGAVGRPKIGFLTEELIKVIHEYMGWGKLDELIIVGCGSLGSALIGYGGFAKRGFKIVAGFDIDPTMHGKEINGVAVFPLSKLANLVKRLHIEIGIIAVPPDAAQEVADVMVEGGIRGIWNFSPFALKVPREVIVQQEDLIASLVILQKGMKPIDKIKKNKTEEQPT
jgi:redox-sensing transcriptional repressor